MAIILGQGWPITLGTIIMTSICCVCKQAFKKGDSLQAKFAILGEPLEWNLPVIVDVDYQKRAERNKDTIKRKHTTCEDTSVPNRLS